MDHVVIKSYTDKNFTQQYKEEIILQVNPSEIQLEKSIGYMKDMQLGVLGGSSVYGLPGL